MTRLGKLPVFILLLGLATLAAAGFGAAHNQLSYTIGPDYFRAFKFIQFDIAPALPDRIGAAIVGVRASWWMGALVGLPAFLYGLLRIPRAASFLAAGIGAIGLVILLTAFAALAGLVAGLVLADTGWLDRIATPASVNRTDFLRAGLMHDASYAGGLAGALVAFWPMRRARARDTYLIEGDRG